MLLEYMQIDANEKPWNAIILVSYMNNWYEKPWKVTYFQAKNPEFRVKPETFHRLFSIAKDICVLRRSFCLLRDNNLVFVGSLFSRGFNGLQHWYIPFKAATCVFRYEVVKTPIRLVRNCGYIDIRFMWMDGLLWGLNWFTHSCFFTHIRTTEQVEIYMCIRVNGLELIILWTSPPPPWT
jgi:hypothetical protein